MIRILLTFALLFTGLNLSHAQDYDEVYEAAYARCMAKRYVPKLSHADELTETNCRPNGLGGFKCESHKPYRKRTDSEIICEGKARDALKKLDALEQD